MEMMDDDGRENAEVWGAGWLKKLALADVGTH